MTYNEIVNFINSAHRYGKSTGEERCRHMLTLLFDDEEEFLVLHVAGTNGKGSVCAFLSSILRECGYRTGLFTSPHLLKINERIKIDDVAVTDELFTEAFLFVWNKTEDLKREGFELAYFDYLFCAAMYIFRKCNVDYVILETGIGGRLDSTNAIHSKALSVITSIGLDHTEVLGDTIEKIAYEKAGIIKPGIPVVFLNQNNGAEDVIREVAGRNKSNYVMVKESQWEIIKNNAKHIDFLFHSRYYKDVMFRIHSSATYQVINCCLALTAIGVLEEQGNGKFHLEAVKRGVSNMFWEGRMEQALKDVYIDGAHNADGIRAFLESVKQIKGERACTLLFSVVKDKHYDAMIEIICQSNLFEHYIITQIEGSRRLDDTEIDNCFTKYTDKSVKVFDYVKDAFFYALDNQEDGVLFCAGSLYLVGDIKQIIQNEKLRESPNSI